MRLRRHPETSRASARPTPTGTADSVTPMRVLERWRLVKSMRDGRVASRLAAGLGGVVLLAACGDSGPEATPLQREALDVLIDGEVTGGEHDCLVEGLLASGVPAEAIIEGTVTAEQDTALTAVTLECVEDLSRIPSFVASFIEGAALEGVELTETQARCTIENLGDAAVDSTAAIAGCLTDGLGEAGGGERYGDDPVLDLLWDACEAGNDQACDELFLGAPVGSDYAEFARTCGGLVDDGTGGRCFDDRDPG